MYSAQGQITYNGPFSTSSATPTALTLGVGTNTISNNITTPPAVQNWFDITLPANMQITNVSFAVNDPLSISSGTMCWNPFSTCSPSDTWASGGQGATAITGWSGVGTLPINSSPGVIQIISGIASNTTWTLVLTVVSTGGGCTNPDVPTVTRSTNNICAGANVTLDWAGAALNDANNWHVYTTNCGSGQVASQTGTSLVVNPTTTTTYFIRGEDGAGCVDESTGSCGQVTVTVDKTASTLTSATASTNNVCPGTAVSLSVTGAAVGSGGVYGWYTGSGGTGTSLGSSVPISVSPTSTTTYYFYMTGDCNTLEESITVTVDKTLSTLTSATASTNNVCPGTAVSISTTGFTLGTGATYSWYTGSGGTGTNLGTSIPMNVSPTTTTTYYMYVTGNCNTLEESITVTVADTTNPTITCPGNTNETADTNCNVSLPDYTASATAADNCDAAPTVTQSPAAGTTISGAGTVQTVTLTVTDASGNFSQCTFDVTVVDNINPTITCPGNTNETADANCNVSLPDYTASATAADNCDAAPTVTQSPAAGTTISGAGTVQTVTLTVTDASGNFSQCTFDVTVVDNINPTITCPGNININTDASSCNATGVALGTPTTADNCSVASVTNDAPATFPLGNTIVTWTVTDGSANTATCTQTVTVTDAELPIVLTQNITITLDENGEGSITPSNIDNGSSDNCSFTLSLDNDTFDCFNLGDYTVTLSVEDVGGNITTATAVVTILGDDLDGDLIVDACDDDIDGDGVLNVDDNCPLVANTNQIDLDQDSIGDSCDDFIDIEITPSDTITPNGDGQNDTWFIENIWRYSNASIKVFNRHGVKVYEGRNYSDDWGGNSTEGGNGLLPAGSYYYTIELNQPEFGNYGVTPVTGWMYINY